MVAYIFGLIYMYIKHVRLKEMEGATFSCNSMGCNVYDMFTIPIEF